MSAEWMCPNVEDRTFGAGWTLRLDAESVERAPAALRERVLAGLSCSIPFDVISVLVAHGVVAHPYFYSKGAADDDSEAGDLSNEEAVQWVGVCDWVVERDVRVDDDGDDEAVEALLSFDGLDTLCDVFLDGRLLGAADNEHRRWNYCVQLSRGRVHRLALHFHSAVRFAEQAATALPYPIPWARGNNRIAHMNLVRSTACRAGWDWGPCLVQVSCAVARLSVHSMRMPCHVEYCTVLQQHCDNGDVRVVVECHVLTVHAAAGTGVELSVDFAGQQQSLAIAALPRPGDVHAHRTAEFVVADAPLWWPRGYGEQHLHDVRVSVNGCLLLHQRVGLRRLELDNRPDDAGGVSMRFIVNGRPIFAKGANWIPADALPSQEHRHTAALLHSAADAGMCMLRVWGGGHFESDAFYQLCDQLGLLLYHDNMFSCSLYPSTDRFLASVRAEAVHQVLRLRHHACIALWCGDNECIGALDWFEESRAARDRYIIGWSKLNATLEQVYRQYDAARTFWPTSPSLGPSDFSDAWRDDRAGDMHMWSVWHEDQSFDAYQAKRPRFVSEFGFQSFPCQLADWCPPQHYSITSPTFEAHQRGGRGNARIIETTARYFRFPLGFFNTLYLSQLLQALAIETAVLYWRTLPTCAGTLFWQLNDCWPAASWSSVEYGGRWKALMYHARRFYAPLALSVYADRQPGDNDGDEKNRLTIVVCNDGSAQCNFTVHCTVIDLAGNALLCTSFSGTASRDRSAVVVSQEHRRHWLQGASPSRRLLVCRLHADDGQLLATQLHAFRELKRLDLREPDIELSRVDDAHLRLTARAAPALYVFVECGVHLRDNSLPVVLPGQPVLLKADAGTLPPDVERTCRVWHLHASYSTVW